MSYERIQEDNGWDKRKTQQVGHILSHRLRIHQHKAR